MNLFAVLAQEHRLFQRLLGALERALGRGAEEGRREARLLLGVLLPALESHEELEDLVFGPREGPRDEASERALARVELEHRKLSVLRAEAAARLEAAATAGWDEERASLLNFVRRLREHMRLEEATLWPRFVDEGRSLSRGLARRAKEGVERLEREMNAALAASSSRGRKP